MKWLGTFLTALLLAVLTAGCADLFSSKLPTPYPTDYIPTVIAMTLAAGQPSAAQSTPDQTTAAQETVPEAAALGSASPTLPQPSATPRPLNTVTDTPVPVTPTTSAANATPTRRPSPTPTLTPTPGIPNAAIQIASPGPLSRIVSPLQLTATLRSVPGGSFHVELWAEPLQPGGEPRLLLREVTNFISNPSPWIFLDEALEFELSRVSELAELRVLTYDAYGRPVAAASVGLILLQLGENQLTPGVDAQEPLVIFEPTPNILIQGGTLIVTGMARPLDSQPLLIELVAADGSIAGVQQLFLTPDPAGEHITFAVEVAYSVASPTWTRLTISQSGVRIPGLRLLNSLEVLLSP